ncbi:translation initiation factor IF-2P [Tubulinosema ratisbonensis]|uniref:Eukaryotic translation initiation factor 5B n=1 Tax=Tubulinosema ratisbonensis TaxID=291195 RepID=A0A437APJ4_9MICR|nr:translation initiation factor IF-2P [Tubulinosema ratisbonensis]
MAKKKSTDLNYLDSLVQDNNKEEEKKIEVVIKKKEKKQKKPKNEESIEKIKNIEEEKSKKEEPLPINEKKTEEKISEQKIIEENKKETILPKTGPKKRVGPNIELIRKKQQEKLLREEEERKEKEEQKRIELEEKERRRIEEENRKKIESEGKKKKDKKFKKVRDVEKYLGNMHVKTKKVESSKKEKVSGDEGCKSPICCILGHVDTGKTKILDKLRETNVQGQEAGGITQQIGATFFPLEFLHEKYKIKTKLPGILIIDTPGHESFSNLRSRGSSLCDFAILVVDFFHLLEPQTLESINLLKLRKTPFIVALNKIDKIYGYDTEKNLESQSEGVKLQFKKGVNETIVKFAEIGFNARLWNENKELSKFISLVPTSAITGEGLNILVGMILKMSETFMKKKTTLSEKFECVVLEVKNVEGFGTTLDVILVDGFLQENDKICVGTMEGPVITKVKSILIPQHCKDAKAKHSYDSVKRVNASMGFKLAANNLERVLTGSKVIKVKDEEEAMNQINEDLNYILKNIILKPNGVHVQASTLGSLEALISFLEKEEVPVFSFSIGDIRKQDITRASISKTPIMLCFDVEFSKEMLEYAKECSVKVFSAKIIYHLVDKYKEYTQKLSQDTKLKYADECIFPFELKILPNCIFTKRSPLILGVEIVNGRLMINKSVYVKREDKIERLGKVTSIENNKKPVNSAGKGDKVAIKIEAEYDNNKMYGRHFDENDSLLSIVTGKSVDILLKYFGDGVSEEEMKLLDRIRKDLEVY